MGISHEALRPLAWTAVTRDTVTSSSKATALSPGYYLVSIEKSSGDGAYVLFGASTATATSSTGLHMQPGEKIPVYVAPGATTHCAYIRKTGDEVIAFAKTGD